MTYYYEISNGSILGKPPGFYYYANLSPAQGGHMNYTVHDAIYQCSCRVWLENANGVTLVKAVADDNSFGIVDESEFLFVKLKAKDITA